MLVSAFAAAESSCFELNSNAFELENEKFNGQFFIATFVP